MEVVLQRDATGAWGTYGVMRCGADVWAQTLEDPVRSGPKVQGDTAIPAGRYEVVFSWSQRFGRRMLQLLGVPAFTGIRVHGGGTKADTAGCVLVGRRRALIGTTPGLLGSKAVLGDVEARVGVALGRGERVWVTVRDVEAA